jgi:hypothetical protein
LSIPRATFTIMLIPRTCVPGAEESAGRGRKGLYRLMRRWLGTLLVALRRCGAPDVTVLWLTQRAQCSHSGLKWRKQLQSFHDLVEQSKYL